MVARMREDRLKQIARGAGPEGFSDRANIDYWSKRASANSNQGTRASGARNPSTTERNKDLPVEHPTGKRMELRDTSKPPLVKRSIDARMVAKKDLNHEGESDYMAGVRRITS